MHDVRNIVGCVMVCTCTCVHGVHGERSLAYTTYVCLQHNVTVHLHSSLLSVSATVQSLHACCRYAPKPL